MNMKMEQPELIRLNSIKVSKFNVWPTIILAVFTGFAIVFWAAWIVLNIIYLGIL